MNIEEYRAMVAEEAQKPEEQPQTPEVVETPSEVETTPQTPVETPTEGTVENEPVVEATPEPTPEPTPINEIEIDGQKFTVEQIKQLTHAQQNALRREQELLRERRELEEARKLQEMIYANPQLAQELRQKGLPILDPQEKQLKEINQKYQDLLLEKEIDTLKGKYQDFDPRAVIQYAYENRLNNLEDAYHLVKVKGQGGQQNVSTPPSNASQSVPAPIDVEALKEQIRQDVLKELQSEVDTGSLMTSNSAAIPVEDNSVRLSSAEMRIAKNLRMTPEEYMKWKSKK